MNVAVVSLGGIGFVAGVILAIASRVFHVDEDPKEHELLEALPGMNCGACGYFGCAAYARAIAAGEADLDRCSAGGGDSREKIYRIMGEPFEKRQEEVVMVFCQGDRSKAKAKYRYLGMIDCRAAQMIADGPKQCPGGCLGFGSCVKACPFGAIEITPLGIATVNHEKCTGCQRCVAVCPRFVIRMVPRNAFVHVLCNSHDRGAVVRKYCQIGCLGGQLCQKVAPGAYLIEDNLARVIYENQEQAVLAVEACPTGCIRVTGEQDLSGSGFMEPGLPDQQVEVA